MTRYFYWYLAALLVICTGAFLAAYYYPGGFDWLYTVASALASQKHNPQGSFWFAGCLSLSMLLLWQYVSALKKRYFAALPSEPRMSFIFLYTGVLSGFLLGIEKLVFYSLSSLFYKSHEVLGLFTFFGLYIGIVSLLIQWLNQKQRSLWIILIFLAPLLAIGIVQLWLYLAQRDLGWVDTSWRDRGIPVWLSFAFWQWLAIMFLWLGLGLLYAFAHRDKS